MPIYDQPDDAPLLGAYARTRWFEAVLEFEYGEREAEEEIPGPLNWLKDLPVDLQFGLDEAECSLAYVAADGAYRAAVWEVTGEDDRPWLMYLVDDFGPRLLTEYSVTDEEADDETLEATLRRAAEELPERLERGEFHRAGDPLEIPEWLAAAPLDEEESAS
jgi:hypothetical protein